MNQMWVEIGLNAFQINCSDDSRYANDQYHIFWQFRSYASNANMANVIWYLTGKLYVSAKTLLFVSLVLFQRSSKLVIQQDYLNSNHVTSKYKDILHKKLHKKISVFNMAS